MKKKLKYGIAGFAVLALLAGCSPKTAEKEGTAANAKGETAAAVTAERITLGQYKGIEVVQKPIEVTDEEVQSTVDDLLRDKSDYAEVTDRPARDKDRVNIDFVGLKDGVAFEGGTSAGYDLVLGSGSFIPGFEEGLIGANKGDELSLNLTFPEQYGSAELAGQAVVFEVTVNAIEELQILELTDELAFTLFEFPTVTDLYDDVREYIKSVKEANANYALKVELLQKAMGNAEYHYPPEDVETEFNRYYEDEKNAALMNGLPIEQWAQQRYHITLEELEGQIRIGAENSLKQMILVEAIFTAESLEVSDDDRRLVAGSQNMELEDLISNYGQEEVDQVAMVYNVMEFLLENAAVK